MRRLLLFVFAMLISACLVACGDADAVTSNNGSDTPDESEERIKIRYAPLGGASGVAVQFGAENGIFEAEGLDVEFINIQDPVTGLMSGDVDVADTPTTNAILSGGQGAPIKIVSSMFRSKGAFYLIANNEIETIEDLKEKTVGIAKSGSGLDVYTRTILKEHGLDLEEDVTLVANGTHQEAYASLTNNQVDATIIHEPFVSLAESEGTGKLLARGWDYLPTFHTGVLVASDKAIKENREGVKRLVAAYFKAQQFAKENIEQFKEFYIENLNVDADVLEKTLERELEIWENDPNVDIQALMDTQQIQIDLGFQEQLFDVENVIDSSFIPEQ